MNYKTISAIILAAGLISSASAQKQLSAAEQKDNLADPDFLITVPLDLKDIPGELYEAVVWCEVMDQNRNVIAQTGGVSVSVDRHQACGANTTGNGTGSVRGPIPCPGQTGYKQPEKWSVTKIWGTHSPQLQTALGGKAGTAGKGIEGKGVDIKTVPPDTFFIGDGRPPAPGWAEVQGLTLRASTPGAVNPASGAGYACHIGFKADVLIDGRSQNITVFGLDGGTLKSLPTRGAPMQKDVTGSFDGRPGEPFKGK